MNQDNDESERVLVAQMTEVQLALRWYVQSLLPGDLAAQDVAQQANATAWTKRAEFVPGTNFKAWIFAIARFEVLNYRKKQARDSRLVFGEELEQLLADDICEADDDTLRRHEALGNCLQKLREKDRELLLHRYTRSAGSLQDYAGSTGRSVGGLKVTLHRLRTALSECISKQLNQAEARV